MHSSSGSPIMHRNKSVLPHDFSMVPRADIPRSKFRRPSKLLTTFDSGYLIPVWCDEVYPGDSVSMNPTLFCRLTTPIFPIMDNSFLDIHWWFVPYRLLWTHWENFMGQQANPGDSISYLVPTISSPANGWPVNSLQDYLGWGTVGQIGAGNVCKTNAWLTRAYNFIWNEWYRDQNLQNSVVFDTGDGPDTAANYVLLRRGKRHDYFTSSLPWPQKGNTAVALPLTGNAPVTTSQAATGSANPLSITYSGSQFKMGTDSTWLYRDTTSGAAGSGLYADLSAVTAATINSIRLAFQTQRLLERDARGGTRYVESILSHFGVRAPDFRLQRPEFLGGGTTPLTINPVAQTSATGVSGGSTPAGTLSAVGTVLSRGQGFTKSFVEHGLILALASVRADYTYQQGVDRWNFRQSRYDFYYPVFSHLGEQSVLNREIYMDGSANDTAVFGYQEVWAELRYKNSQITGQFRSTYTTPLDGWHLAQKFTSLPTLNSTFIQETPPFSRVIAVGSGANGSQFYMDANFDSTWTRPLPMYGVPGDIDRF